MAEGLIGGYIVRLSSLSSSADYLAYFWFLEYIKLISAPGPLHSLFFCWIILSQFLEGLVPCGPSDLISCCLLREVFPQNFLKCSFLLVIFYHSIQLPLHPPPFLDFNSRGY